MSFLEIFKGKEKRNIMPKLQRIATRKKADGINEIYLKIDNKNSLNQVDEDYISEVNYRFSEYKAKENEDLEMINKIMNKYYEKKEIKYDDYFTLSQNISKQIIRNLRIDKDTVENSLTKLIRNNFDKDTLVLSRNNCTTIGQVLCYGYSKMNLYKIKDMKQLLKTRISIVTKKIDILKEFKAQNREKLGAFCKSKRHSYELLPEIIILINRYASVKTVEVNLEKIADESLISDDFLYIQLTILNIYWLLNSLNTIKFNFILSELENLLFSRYKDLIEKFARDNNLSIKTNNAITNQSFDNKWNFTDIYKKREIPEEDPDILMQHKSIDLTHQKEKLLFANTMEIPKRNTLLGNLFGSKKVEETSKITRESIVQKYKDFLDLIMMCFISLNNADTCINIELIMNDCFTYEFLLYFNKFYEMEWISSNNIAIFHVFNLLLYNNVMKQINKLNIEINTLEPFTFDKLLNFLYYNSSLTALNLSFFSADITYTTGFIFKAFKGAFNQDELLKNYDPNTYLFDDYKNLEDKMLSYLDENYVYHLALLYEIIRKKKMLQELGFNFDIPSDLLNNKNYINAIYKFILNSLFFISRSSIHKFVLLAPDIIIDGRTNPNFNKLMEGLKISNNRFLASLSLQMQFYQIINIKNFLSFNLKILNIGDLDLASFKLLTDKICTYEFNKGSCLEQLSISLLKKITNLSFELRKILEKLLRIKINSLAELNIITNLQITNKYDLYFLLKIINKNWIPNFKMIFNPCSQTIINEHKNELNKIYYLENNKNTGANESFWMLKYLFNNRYVDNLKNDDRIKEMVYDILKYLFHTKRTNISLSDK